MSIHTSTESLVRLATIVDADLGAVDALRNGESASIIRVTNSGEIAIRSLDGEHPFDALIGFAAPDDWEVFGVIAPGWGSYYAGPKKGQRRRMRAIFLCSRRGEEASVLRFAGEHEGTVMTEPTAPGRVPDCVRRALDVATPAAAEETLLAYWWDRTLQRLIERNHPSRPSPVQLTEIDALIGERPISWADERWQAVVNDGNRHMDGAVAAWMDDGMFARFMLGEIGEAETTLSSAKLACTTEAWTHVLHRFADVALEEGLFEDEDDDSF